MTHKYNVGDRIMDLHPGFGPGTIVKLEKKQHYNFGCPQYAIRYDSDPEFPTSSCPEIEIRLLTKLDKVL